MAFPAAGPTTKELVKAHLGITDDVDDTAISGVVAAVNVKVKSWPVAKAADTDPAPADWAGFEDVVYGSTLLAARLFRRKDTPDGIAGFADGAPAYVSRNDPDVALMLKIGTNQGPAVG